jgi:Capsule assembly protein Wzi
VPQPASPIAAYNRPRVIEGYISLNLKGWQASFGKQSLWTSPTQDPFMFSNNAEPLYMLRIDQTSPKELPGFLKFLGPYRTQIFFGKVTGQHYVNAEGFPPFVSLGRSLDKQPMIHGEQISFKPTPNFEFGIDVSTLWGGPGVPITLGEVKRTFLTFTNPTGAGVLDPGDRRSNFYWSYRIPGLRNWLTIYQDSFTEDEISPIGYPRRAAQDPGLYLSHLPMLPHMDFRFEGGYTALPNLLQPIHGGFFYWNVGYLDGYTNKGDIIGNTIGREGIIYRASTTYWVAPDKNIKFSYRNAQTDKEFLQGGNVKDYRVSSEWSFKHNLSLTSLLQYESWNFPVLAPKPQTNFTASFQLTYSPHWRLKGKSEDY